MLILELILTVLILSNECGTNHKENVAIASTIFNRSIIRNTNVITELTKPHQYPINKTSLKNRIKERGLKTLCLKMVYTIEAKVRPLKYTHYCALYVNPSWCKDYTVIGEHKFVYIGD